MLTQLELVGSSGGLGVNEDSGSVASPLDDLPQYPLEQAEFEYFETSLGDGEGYYDVRQSMAIPPPLTTPEYSTGGSDVMMYDHHDMPTFTNNLQFSQDISSYQDIKPSDEELKFSQDISSYQDIKPSDEELKFSQDISSYQDIKPSEEELKFSQDITSYQDMDIEQSGGDDLKLDDDMSSYEEFSGNFYDSSLSTSESQTDDFGLRSLYDGLDPNHHHSLEMDTPPSWGQGCSPGTGKGKIGPLQRRALDSIFSVTEKPSRGMALHIASELGLHYLTVKNFFSNGRRRLRRAAAKLSDPERSRRENERRKEKRRLTALTSAALAGDGRVGCASVGRVAAPHSPPLDFPSHRDTPVVSPERKALMEKLADKVQRSVAQRSLAAEFNLTQPNSVPTQHQHQAHTNTPPSQSTLDLLTHQNDMPTSNFLSQASHDILASPDQALMNPSPQDFLTSPTQDMTPASPTLLHPHSDPWSLF